MDAAKNEILEASLKYFRKHGVRKMTNDKLVALLGISTKTLYKHFKDKEDLLEQVLQLFFSENYRLLEELNSKQWAVTLLFDVWSKAIELEYTVNNRFYHDLHYYYPELEKKIEKRNSDKFWKKLIEIFTRGMEEGDLITDVIPEAVLEGMTILYLSVARGDKFKRFRATPFEIMLNTIIPYIKGICTNKGALKLTEHIAIYNGKRYGKNQLRQVTFK
jgi:AcrR family transcriptional regulator